MGIRRRDVLKVAGYSVAGIAGTSVGMRSASADEGSPIVRDVCVIGGGSAGTYTAVRLGDLGRSVVVVEPKGRLGGDTDTYHHPGAGGAIGIGGVVFEDQPHARACFSPFRLPPPPPGGGARAG